MTIIPALTIIYDSIWLKTVRCVFEVMQLKIKKNYIRNRMISNRVIQRFPIKINCLQLINTFAKIVVEKLFDKPVFIDLAHIYKNSRYN